MRSIKYREARLHHKQSGSKARIKVDGGVGLNNAKEVIEAGADVLVAGNAVCLTSDPALTISQIKNAIAK
jgi:ribulose-phosphate 3-epimerase